MKMRKDDEVVEKSKTEWKTVKIGGRKSKKWMKEREKKMRGNRQNKSRKTIKKGVKKSEKWKRKK